jgi:hypothetical protein
MRDAIGNSCKRDMLSGTTEATSGRHIVTWQAMSRLRRSSVQQSVASIVTTLQLSYHRLLIRSICRHGLLQQLSSHVDPGPLATGGLEFRYDEPYEGGSL